MQLWTGTATARHLGPSDPDRTPADVDGIATAWTCANDGVRPNVRVLEQDGLPRLFATAGSAP